VKIFFEINLNCIQISHQLTNLCTTPFDREKYPEFADAMDKALRIFEFNTPEAVEFGKKVQEHCTQALRQIFLFIITAL
jgi:hypothetical protein